MDLFAFVRWNVEPEIIQAGPLTIRYYGLLFGLLFWIGYLLVRWQFRIEKKNEDSLTALLFYVVISALVGARLGHCFFYEPDYYLKHPLEIFAIWRGGLASHGGAIGILIAIYFYSRRHPDQPFLWVMDRIVVPTALGGAMIRIGNLFNSEILGLPTQLPWAFVFQQVDNVPRHPVQLYESLSYLLIFALLLTIYRRLKGHTPHGLLLGVFLAAVFSARFLLEFFKERQANYEHGLAFSVGQLLSLPFVIAGIVLAWRAWTAHNGQRTGTAQTASSQA